MSARLLTVLILPTLLLAVSLTPAPAAQQPAEPVKPAKIGEHGKVTLVTKVYQVTDLVIPMLSNEAAPKDDTKGCATCTTSRAPSAVQLYLREHGKACPKAECDKSNAGTCEQQLIDLIQTSISPTSWTDAGGTWSVEYFPLTHALVINAPPDAQEQIMDLLAALRRLQDREVALEVRFLQVSDEFYKPLKDDFELKDCKDGPMASFDEKRLVQFMEAVQCDQGTQVMQAPKITMFNGQKSTVRVLENKYFVTSLSVRWNDDLQALVAIPMNEPVQLGMEMALQPIISADHGSVQLDLNVKNTRLDAVQLIPSHLVLKPGANGKCQAGVLTIHPPVDSPAKAPNPPRIPAVEPGEAWPVIFTQFIQKPKIAKVSFERKLNLPEGKTAVLFGWKQTSEVIDAVPVLSKLPVIGKHYQHKRQVPETVLVLVTPRVIVPKEEEERQTGIVPVLPQPAEEVLPAPKPVPAKWTEVPAPRVVESREVLPMPRPVQAKAMPKGDAEESEGPPSVDDLLAKYHQACAAGKKDAARKIAIKALKMDPTCFDRKHGE